MCYSRKDIKEEEEEEEEKEEEEDEDEEKFARSEREIAGVSTCEDVHRRVRAARDLLISAITFLDVKERRRFLGSDGSLLETRCAILS